MTRAQLRNDHARLVARRNRLANDYLKEQRMADQQQPPNVGGQPHTAAAPVGHPGNLWDHLTQLSAQLRAKDFAGALGTFGEIVNFLRRDFDAVPVFRATALAAGPAPMDAARCADQIDQFVGTHRANAQSGTQTGGAGAFPWGPALQLLLQALMAILARQ